MGNYNEFAGQSRERLAAISDGIFGVGMTLLVLDMRTPAASLIHSDADLGRNLIALAPNLAVYVMSFLTLGIFWVGQQTQLNLLQRADRNLAWLHLGFLFCVTLMPFSTELIGSFIQYRIALLIYWGNILLLGTALLCTWRYAVRAGLVDKDLPIIAHKGVERRILIAQALYAFGAALCVINTYWSLGFIVLVQLNYVIAPRIGFLQKLKAKHPLF
jgi:uncharacterized membrane protein